MIDFPYNALIDSLRALVLSHFSIPVGNRIEESGAYLTRVETANLPMAILQLESGVSVEEGPAVNDLSSSLEYTIWLIRAAVEEVDNQALIRTALSSLAAAIYTGSGKKMGGTASNTTISKVDWTGASKQWPFDVEPGAGVVAGYLTAKFLLVESRL